MRIDLHTHSRASDGTQTPEELIRAAAAAGLDVVALTDHDTSEGWAEAAGTARELGITLVRGMEISTRHNHQGVHLLGYLPDPTYPPLVEGLQRILDGRNSRVPAVIERLRGCGIDISKADVDRVAGDPAATGRPHIADALVDLGVVRDRDEAFARYLSPGRPAYVDRYAAPLVDMIRVVGEAGGVTVIAHAWGRHAPTGMTADDIAALAQAGLSGLEVDHQDHDTRSRKELAGIADDLGLVKTGSSDYHGTGKKNHELGCNTTAPDQFERLVDLADAAAVASGRPVTDVLRP
ncbi:MULTISPECIES: PHP domain-containing protein [unclassified Nocardioides]|uniref:PHP domain-containing protein n=1 Tax=unclassified Nocardioides TaxID=2615069 RepID=UPI0007002DB9|nr:MULTISPECIES: PHP domain-containing protein [unclassified Nocardioides]KQY56235.1 metal-dependent phosphoesterase [Nocardioides sp. Root140]KQZ75019.1 metal-dependent phosphoesterase [Nocardioides sp. Root151]KRF10554.1 metal-dependent phosphoesterase [Nocardioides sp. Soil796]